MGVSALWVAVILNKLALVGPGPNPDILKDERVEVSSLHAPSPLLSPSFTLKKLR